MNDLDQAARVVEPYIGSDFRRGERAIGIVEDLYRSGLLAGQSGPIPSGLSPRDAAANLLQCRLSWPDADRVASQLEALGLLVTAEVAR